MARIHQPECRGCQYQEVSVKSKSRSKGFSTTWLRHVGRGILQPLQAGPCPYKQEDIGGALVVQVVLINSEDQTDHIQIYPACTVWPRYSRLRYLRHGTWMEGLTFQLLWGGLWHPIWKHPDRRSHTGTVSLLEVAFGEPKIQIFFFPLDGS